MTNSLGEVFSTDNTVTNFAVVTVLGLVYLLLANWIEYIIMLLFSLRFWISTRKWFFCYHLHLTSSLYDSVPGLKAALSERLSYKDGVLGFPLFTSPKDPKNTDIKNFSDICEETRRQGFFFLSTRSSILLFIRDNEQTQNLLKGEKPSKAMWSKYKELLSDECWAMSSRFSGQRQLRIVICSSREHFTGTLCFYRSIRHDNSPCTLDRKDPTVNACFCRSTKVRPDLEPDNEEVNFCVIRSKDDNIYFDDDNALDPVIKEDNNKFCYLVALRKSGIGYRRCLAIAIQLFGVTEYNAMVLSGMRFSCFVRILSHLSTRFDRSYFIEGCCSNDTTFTLVRVLRDVEGILRLANAPAFSYLKIPAQLCAVAATIYAASLSGVVLTEDLEQSRDEAVQSIMEMSTVKGAMEAKQPPCSKAEARDALIAAWGAVRHLWGAARHLWGAARHRLGAGWRLRFQPKPLEVSTEADIQQALLAATVAAVSAVMSCAMKPQDASVDDEINPIRASARYLHYWEKTRALRCLNSDGLESITSSLFPSSCTAPCTSVVVVVEATGGVQPLVRFLDHLHVLAADVLRRPNRVDPANDPFCCCIRKTKAMLTSEKHVLLNAEKAKDETCIRVGYGSEGVFFNVDYDRFWGRGFLSHNQKKQETPKGLTGSIPGDIVLGGYFQFGQARNYD